MSWIKGCSGVSFAPIMWVGVAFLAAVGWGVGLLGVGIIALGGQATRKYFALKLEVASSLSIASFTAEWGTLAPRGLGTRRRWLPSGLGERLCTHDSLCLGQVDEQTALGFCAVGCLPHVCDLIGAEAGANQELGGRRQGDLELRIEGETHAPRGRSRRGYGCSDTQYLAICRPDLRADRLDP